MTGWGRRRGERPRRTLRDILILVAFALVAGLLLKAFLVSALFVASRSMTATLLPGDFVLVNKLAYAVALPRCLPLLPGRTPILRLVTLSSPRRGDILAFYGQLESSPPCAAPTLIKRCVGLPGDTIDYAAGGIRINSAPVAPAMPGTPRESVRIVIPRAGETVPLTARTAPVLRPLIEQGGHTLALEAESRVLLDGRPAQEYRTSEDAYFVLGDNTGASIDSRSFGLVPASRIIGKAFLVYWSRDLKPQGSAWVNPLAGVRWGRIGALVR